MTHQNTNRWHRWAVALATALLCVAGAQNAHNVIAAPVPPPPPLPGAVGPIAQIVLQAQGAFTRPVVQEGITVYVNAKGVTATGAQPIDAVRGFTPAKTGESHGPDVRPAGCFEGDLPPQALHDHATFTPAELKQYGLPSATDLGVPADEWASMMRNLQHITCTSHTVYDDGMPLTAGMIKQQQKQQAQNSAQALAGCIDFCGAIEYTPPDTGCPGTTVFLCVDRHTDHFDGGEVSWSGFGTDRSMCNPAVCPPLTEVTSYWHVPVAHDKGVPFDDSYHWVGLGGLHSFAVNCDGETSNPSLVQVGTRSYHLGATPTYSAWYENCSGSPFGAQELPSPFIPAPGDLMQGYVGSTNSAHPASIYLQDWTGNWAYTWPDGPPGSIWPAPDQETAECVAEVPAHNWPSSTPQGPWQGETDWGNLGIHFEACRAWTGYNSSSIIGIGSVPNNKLLLWRSWYLDGVPTYCSSTQWFDSFDPTYGYTSYSITALATIAEGGSPQC